jgi:glucose-6-phosphate dehydrogenase assembly protein OpcA
MTPTAVVKPERLLKDLQAEWVRLGKAESESSDRSAGVLRAVTMTVMVGVESGADESAALEALSQLMHEHPARAIILRLNPTDAEPLAGRAYAMCWMPFGRRSQICCEQIELSAGAENFGEIPRLLQALVAPDLPVIFWCRAPRVFSHPAFRKLAALADKVIVDSRSHTDPQATAKFLHEQLHQGRLYGDLTWTRLTRWRQTVAAAFERADCRTFFDSLTRVEIHYTHAPEPMAARYLRAWLQSILGSRFPVDLVHSPGDESVTWQIRDIRFSGPQSTVVIERPEKGIAEIQVEQFRSRAFFDNLDEAQLVREEIAILGRDPVFNRAVHLLSLSH